MENVYLFWKQEIMNNTHGMLFKSFRKVVAFERCWNIFEALFYQHSMLNDFFKLFIGIMFIYLVTTQAQSGKQDISLSFQSWFMELHRDEKKNIIVKIYRDENRGGNETLYFKKRIMMKAGCLYSLCFIFSFILLMKQFWLQYSLKQWWRY